MELAQQQLTIPAEASGRRLDQVLAELLPDYSRSRLKQWILEGHVRLDGEIPEPRTRVAGGQLIAIQVGNLATGDEYPAPVAEDIRFDVVHEDADVLVINKPAGLVVHPGAGNAFNDPVSLPAYHAMALALGG